jgi:predicted site-specific integrase-resolvase
MDGKQKERNFVTVGQASVITGLDSQTIRKLADNSSIVCYRTPAGQRRINLQSIQDMCTSNLHDKKEQTIQKQNFIYARVSTKKQMDDLSRQIVFLRKPEYSEYILIQDIASGINFKRKGLSTILESCLQNNIGEIIVAHRDRLCRFGFDLIESLVTKAGGKITVLDNSENKTCEQELTEDLLSIIHVFSCRQMGKRSYANRKNKNDKDTNISDNEPEETS